MADMNVERRGPSIWPWIIGLIVLALLVYLLANFFNREEEPVGEGASEVELVEPGVTP